MIIPVRCFSCGKVHSFKILHDELSLIIKQVTGDLWERFVRLIDAGVNDGSVRIHLLEALFEALTDDLYQRCHGSIKAQPLLLSPHGHDPRRPDRKVTEVRRPLRNL